MLAGTGRKQLIASCWYRNRCMAIIEGETIKTITFGGAPWLRREALEARLDIHPGEPLILERLVEGLERLLADERIRTVAPPIIDPVEGGVAS